MSRQQPPGVFLADSATTLLVERWLFFGVFFLVVVPGVIVVLMEDRWPPDWSTGSRPVDAALLLTTVIAGAWLMVVAVPAMTYRRPLEITGGAVEIPFWAGGRLPIRVAQVRLDEIAGCRLVTRRPGADSFLEVELRSGRRFRFYVEWLSRYHDSRGIGFVDWMLNEFGGATNPAREDGFVPVRKP